MKKSFLTLALGLAFTTAFSETSMGGQLPDALRNCLKNSFLCPKNTTPAFVSKGNGNFLVSLNKPKKSCSTQICVPIEPSTSQITCAKNELPVYTLNDSVVNGNLSFQAQRSCQKSKVSNPNSPWIQR